VYARTHARTHARTQKGYVRTQAVVCIPLLRTAQAVVCIPLQRTQDDYRERYARALRESDVKLHASDSVAARVRSAWYAR